MSSLNPRAQAFGTRTERQDRDVHEALVLEDASHQHPLSRRARRAIAVGGGALFALTLAGGAVYLYVALDPAAVGVLFGLLLLMLVIWSVFLVAMERVVWREHQRAEETAHDRHPEDFPAAA